MAHMASSLSGYGGMFQDYLDLPPPFTGAGITPSIGADFLTAYQEAFGKPQNAGLSTF
jgi:hypothetical protein